MRGLLILGVVFLCSGCEWVAGITDRTRGSRDQPCESGQSRCSSGRAQRCDDAVWVDEQGSLGCEFSAVTLPTLRSTGSGSAARFALLIGNPGPLAATVTITRGTFQSQTTIEPEQARQLELPWVQPLSNPGAGSVVETGAAYRLISDRPVAVVQLGGANPATHDGDASTLLPWHLAGTTALAVGGGHILSSISDVPSYVAVVAKSDGTQLTVTGSPSSEVHAVGGVNDKGTGTLLLNAGDVALLQSRRTVPAPSMCGWNNSAGWYGCLADGTTPPAGTQPMACTDVLPKEGEPCDPSDAQLGLIGCCATAGATAVWCATSSFPCPGTGTGICHEQCPIHAQDPVADVSGIRISANKPIVAFSGHVCARSPLGVKYCGHTEVSLSPRAAGQQIVLAPDGAWEVRIVAEQAGVPIEITPAPPSGSPWVATSAGQTLAFAASSQAVIVESTAPVAIAGARVATNAVTTAMTPGVELARARRAMSILVPAKATDVSVDVAGPLGAQVTFDGQQISLADDIGHGVGLHRFAVTGSAAPRLLTLTASGPVVAQVHAYLPVPQDPTKRVAYWYPATP